MDLELIKTFTEYHLDMTRRVWESIDHITEEQFLADDAYSRGSIRNLMVHLAATDSNWLAGFAAHHQSWYRSSFHDSAKTSRARYADLRPGFYLLVDKQK